MIASIDKDLFIKRYAFGFLEHYIKAVKNNQKIEESSVIIDFIKYLKKLNIKSSELFCYVLTFKASLIDFAFKLEIQSIGVFEKIVYYFEGIFQLFWIYIQNQ